MQAIILGITATITVINIYLIWRLYQMISSTMQGVQRKLADLHIDSKISTMFSSGGGSKGADSLAGLLFKNVKTRFDLKGNSYFELVEEIKFSPKIRPELKKGLVDFFNKMIQVSYKQESMSEEEKEDLRKEVKVIIKRIQSTV